MINIVITLEVMIQRIYYDIVKNSWSKVYVPTPNKTKMAVVQDNNQLHMIGGKNEDGTFSDKYQVLDLTTNTVTEKVHINGEGIEGAAAFKSNGKIFLIGGKSQYGISGAVQYYNLYYNYWIMTGIAGIFIPSYEMFKAMVGEIFYMLGGYTSGSEGGIKSLSKINKDQNDITISTSLYKIYFDSSSQQLVSQELKNDMPPLAGGGVSWIDINEGDTIFYAFSGISNISSSGDTTRNTNFYRYNITDDLVQQYDTVQHIWDAIINSINETEFDKNINLQIYPNPATSEISFSIPSSEKIVKIKVYNSNGQLVKQINRPENTTVNVSDLNAGLYFIRIDTEANRYLSKMIKK